jgi:hypothetical protein
MIRTWSIILVALSVTASAAEPVKVRSYEAVIVEPLPAATRYMTRGEFARWARQENKAALDDAFARNEAIRSGKPAPKERRALVNKSTGTINRRFGGGVGYEGFGGSGGYSGYNLGTGAAGGVAPLYNYNYGYGFNNPGNASKETNDQYSISYEMVYGDVQSWDGGAVTVINPFCPPK